MIRLVPSFKLKTKYLYHKRVGHRSKYKSSPIGFKKDIKSILYCIFIKYQTLDSLPVPMLLSISVHTTAVCTLGGARTKQALHGRTAVKAWFFQGLFHAAHCSELAVAAVGLH